MPLEQDEVPAPALTRDATRPAPRRVRRTLPFPETRGLSILQTLCVVLVLLAVGVPAARGAPKKKPLYTVNVAWSREPFTASDLPARVGSGNKRFYTTRFRIQGETWYLLRLGVFRRREDAEKQLRRLKAAFPRARVVTVGEKERKAAAAHEISPATVSPKPAAPAMGLAAGREALAAGDHFAAIRNFKAVLLSKDPAVQADAMEGLGLAYEQNGQSDEAIRTYADWLKRFGDHEAADRIRTRLASLRTEGAAVPVELSYPYVINLASSRESFTKENTAVLDAFASYRLYVTIFEKGGKRWYRLRLGFFPNRRAAESFLKALGGTYRDAWVAKTSLEERKRSASRVLVAGVGPAERVAAPAPPVKKIAPVTGSWPALSEARLAELMDEAEVAMSTAKYDRAVQLYTKVLRYPGHKYRSRAQELLGLARERKGQFAHARAEYEAYLRLYPKGEDADRVRQRLDGLVTRAAPPKEKLKPVKHKPGRQDFYGSLSQFYNRDETFSDLAGNRLNRSSLETNLDFNYRYRNDEVQLRSRFSGGYEWSFLKDPDDLSRLTSLYVEALHRAWRVSGRVGRQSASSGGILGRFDGAVVGYEVYPGVRLNLVAGFPVLSSTDVELNTDEKFWGINADLGTFFDRWDANIFFIDQYADGLVDRRAVGGELRYFRAGASMFTLVDYDIFFNELTTALFTATYTLPTRSILSLQADYRKSPSLTLLNAAQGQAVFDISELRKIFSDDELKQLAEDRTADSWFVTLNASHPITDRLQISGDVTVTELMGTPASGGVPEIPGTGLEYFYNLQFIGSSLLKPGDITTIGVRFSDTRTAKLIALSLNSRYPVSRTWRFNPRIRLDFKKNRDASDELTALGSFRTEYRWKRRFTFDLEAGGEWSDFQSDFTEDKTFGYFLSAGYRYDF